MDYENRMNENGFIVYLNPDKKYVSLTLAVSFPMLYNKSNIAKQRISS